MSTAAKRAAYLMIAIGIGLLAVSFLSTMYALLKPEWLDAQLEPHRALLRGNPLLERPGLTWLIAIAGALGLVESGLSIGLGLLILRGRRWAIVTSIVLTLMRLLIVGLFALLAALASVADGMMVDPAQRGPSAEDAAAIVSPAELWSGVAATGVLVVLLVWLLMALRRTPPNVSQSEL